MFNKKRGFSIIELLLASGLIGAAAYMSSSLFVNSAKQKRLFDERFEYVEVLKNIRDIMSITNNCFTNLGEKKIGQKVSITEVANLEGDKSYKVGEIYHNNLVKIKDMYLEEKGLTGEPILNLFTDQGVGPIYFSVVFESPIQGASQRNEIKRTFELQAIIDNAEKIKICSASPNEENWNPSDSYWKAVGSSPTDPDIYYAGGIGVNKEKQAGDSGVNFDRLIVEGAIHLNGTPAVRGSDSDEFKARNIIVGLDAASQLIAEQTPTPNPPQFGATYECGVRNIILGNNAASKLINKDKLGFCSNVNLIIGNNALKADGSLGSLLIGANIDSQIPNRNTYWDTTAIGYNSLTDGAGKFKLHQGHVLLGAETAPGLPVLEWGRSVEGGGGNSFIGYNVSPGHGEISSSTVISTNYFDYSSNYDRPPPIRLTHLGHQLRRSPYGPKNSKGKGYRKILDSDINNPNVFFRSANIGIGDLKATNPEYIRELNIGNFISIGNYRHKNFSAPSSDPQAYEKNLMMVLGPIPEMKEKKFNKWKKDNEEYALRVQGSVLADVIEVSDARLKKDIEVLQTDEETHQNFMNLNPVSFKWISSGASSAGFIAQDVLREIPYLVNTGGYHLSLKMSGFYGVIVNEINYQTDKSTDLDNKLNNIELRLKKLENEKQGI